MSNELEKYEIGQKAELAYLDAELVNRIATVVQKVAQWARELSAPEIGLVVRRAISMGVDPLNPHEVQIWKDKRGTINLQLGYPLMTEWVKRFKGKHTEPQYFRLTTEQMSDEGLRDTDVAHHVKFVMIDDLSNVLKFAEVFGPEMARQMYTVTGLGVATEHEWNQKDKYGNDSFAPTGRSKSWKIKKRALVDAYRTKFGTPTQAEIMELRRMVSYDAIEPEDWEATVDLAPGDAAALAKSRAQWDGHKEAMATDAEYREEHTAQNASATGALFGEPEDVKVLDDDKLKADIAHAAEVVNAFESPEKAIAWAISQGAFGFPDGSTGPLARKAYNDLKDTEKPASADAMAALWRADVAQRLTEKEAEYPLKDE